MDPFKSTKNPKALKATIIAVVVVLLACVICVGAYGIYKVLNTKYVEPNFPTPIVGNDATAEIYQKAAAHGKTRTVCVQGRIKGFVDDSVYWSGFIVSADGYIVTSYSCSTANSNTAISRYTDFVVRVLDSNDIEQTYYAIATARFNKITDIAILKIKNAPAGTVFDFFEIENSSVVDFGSAALIMGNPVNTGLMAHSASIGNPSTTYRDSAGLNDYMETAVMLINGAINVGSKGSPLINGDGKIVGMVLSRYLISTDKHPNDTIMDLGFAAKSDDIISLVELIKESA